MRLNLQTDYALRQLMYLAINQGRLCTIREISEYYGISNNHMIKIAYLSGQAGFIATTRGRSGGLALKMPPEQIVIGDIVRKMEPDFAIVECFQGDANNQCVVSPACKLKHVLNNALQAFTAVLDQYTLADLVERNDALRQLLLQEVA